MRQDVVTKGAGPQARTALGGDILEGSSIGVDQDSFSDAGRADLRSAQRVSDSIAALNGALARLVRAECYADLFDICGREGCLQGRQTFFVRAPESDRGTAQVALKGLVDSEFLLKVAIFRVRDEDYRSIPLPVPGGYLAVGDWLPQHMPETWRLLRDEGFPVPDVHFLSVSWRRPESSPPAFTLNPAASGWNLVAVPAEHVLRRSNAYFMTDLSRLGEVLPVEEGGIDRIPDRCVREKLSAQLDGYLERLDLFKKNFGAFHRQQPVEGPALELLGHFGEKPFERAFAVVLPRNGGEAELQLVDFDHFRLFPT